MLQPPTLLLGIRHIFWFLLLFWFSFHLSVFLVQFFYFFLPFFNLSSLSSLPHLEYAPLLPHLQPTTTTKNITNKSSIFLHIQVSSSYPQIQQTFLGEYPKNLFICNEFQNLHLVFDDWVSPSRGWGSGDGVNGLKEDVMLFSYIKIYFSVIGIRILIVW